MYDIFVCCKFADSGQLTILADGALSHLCSQIITVVLSAADGVDSTCFSSMCALAGVDFAFERVKWSNSP